jgi:NAD-specific glutamate dehydrogenase
VEVATAARVDIGYAAKAYFDLGERIGLTWIKEQIESLAADGHWQAVARGTAARQSVRACSARSPAAVLASARAATPARASTNGSRAMRRRSIR